MIERARDVARDRVSRLPLIVLMLAAIVAAGLLRPAALEYQQRHSATALAGVHSASALGSMNSFALALLLGGLRGPLAMFLWATSEAQKADRNLEDFDTKVEWIRLLQPEFDTVHIFQIWNKAYNISVQMASLPNRYAAVLDALDYAAEVDKSRPADLNIMNAIAQVYSNKLGTPHSEKAFYRRWVREQSFVPDGWTGQDPNRNRVGFQRRRMDPKIDKNGMLLPELLRPRQPRPAGLPADSEWNTGAELQYLEPYQPFPYGVSTFALAYNYAKRAQVLMTVGKQSPLQVSDGVIDSRPALELKAWSEDEWERGRTFEMQAMGVQQAPTDRLLMELPTAAVPPDAARLTGGRAALDAALFAYAMAARTADDAIKEYERHLKDPTYLARGDMYQSHMDTMRGIHDLCQADRAYLEAASLDAKNPDREKRLTEAAQKYQDAIGDFQLIVLKYYVDESVGKVYPDKVNRANIAAQPREVQDETMRRFRAALQQLPGGVHDEDVQEYETYIARATTRLGQLLRR